MSERASLCESLPRVYVVALGRLSIGDYHGVSCDAERVWFEHVSSSLRFLRIDTTTGFRDRREELAAVYPDGFESIVINLTNGDELPPEIAHHFTKVDE